MFNLKADEQGHQATRLEPAPLTGMGQEDVHKYTWLDISVDFTAAFKGERGKERESATHQVSKKWILVSVEHGI